MRLRASHTAATHKYWKKGRGLQIHEAWRKPLPVVLGDVPHMSPSMQAILYCDIGAGIPIVQEETTTP